MSITALFLRLIAPHWHRALLALLLGGVTVGSHIGLMTTSAYLISLAALHPPVLDLMVAIVGVRFFGIARAVFRYLERYVSHDVTFRILKNIRICFYKALEPLAPAGLLRFRSGDLLSRIVADVESLQYIFLRVLNPLLVALLVLSSYAAFLGYYSLKLSGVFVGCFLIAGTVIPLGIKIMGQGIGQKLIGVKSELKTVCVDCMQGMTDILAYGQERSLQTLIADLSRTLRDLQRKSSRLAGLSSAITGLITNLTLWLILVLSIPLVRGGQIPGTHLAMLALGALSSFEAVMSLPLAFHYLEISRAAVKRLWEVIKAEPPIQAPPCSPIPRNFAIQAEDLFFRYAPDEPWVLKGINFYLPNKGKIAIVGPSGSGKSTLVNLLLRFWEYDRGRLLFGGYDLRAYRPEDLRALIGVVTQRIHIFNATIRENLLLAKPDATDSELKEAARKAKLHDFIQTLPEGYDTYVGEGGFKLSGGQRQRLAIARVLLKNAPVLILDEATAGLDPLTEREVMTEIASLMQGRTTILITHDLTALEDMDEILVMREGKLAKLK